MKGIAFSTVHTYRDFGLILTKKEIGSPTVKESKLDIPGTDGSIDMTDFFGEPKYEDVTHRFEFSALVSPDEALTLFSVIKNALHGKKHKIILDDDPAFYYVGRCYVSGYTDEKGIGKLSVECDCEPYKYKASKTAVTVAINGTQTITLTNARKRAVPAITATAAMTIGFGGGSWTISAGTYTIPELELVEGDNLVAVTGTGSITFTWQEGGL